MPERTATEHEHHGPDEQVEEIRRLTAEVWRRVQEWHDAPDWQDNEQNRHRYELTNTVVTALQDSTNYGAATEAVRPLINEWHPRYAGPEQAIYAAIARLRAAATPIP